MPPRFKKVIDPPVTSSTYTQLIKECCVRLPDVKEYVGKCIAEFRKEAEKRNEKKNFKFTVKSEKGEKLFCLKVTGGFKGLTRTKYYVNHGGIYRYDWRSKAWKVIKIIGVIVAATAVVAGAIFGIFNHVDNMLEFNDSRNDFAIEYKDDYSGDKYGFGYDDYYAKDDHYANDYQNESESGCWNEYDEQSDSCYEENEDFDYEYDEDEGYKVENNYQTEYINCCYWNEYRYCFVKFSCCDEWCCCRYCHMDNLDHRISTSQRFQIYCLRCSTVFWSSRPNCPNCFYEHLYPINFEQIANRCRFLLNSGTVPKKNCCDSFICCYRCHNEEYDHKADFNLAYYCCNCSNETALDTNYCTSCGSQISTGEFNLERIPLKCPFFKSFYYLFKFPCCLNVYCCSKCHNNCEDHSSKYSTIKICINCGSESNNSLDNFKCSGCYRRLMPAQSR